MYHVTKALPIRVVSEEYGAIMVDSRHDSVSYGGEWNIGGYNGDENVQLVLVNPNSAVTKQQLSTGKIRFGAELQWYTKYDGAPGSSGSPFINEKGEIVGLFGKGWETGEGFASLIVQDMVGRQLKEVGKALRSLDYDTFCTPNVLERQVIDWYPGKGKLRKFIVALAKDSIQLGKRLIVLTPTRVVRDEVINALRETFPEERLGSHTYDVKNFKVTVMCHATFITFWARKINQRLARIIVMDEAHFLDPRSIAVRRIMDSNYAKGIASVYYFSHSL
ncbi:unnamed protein product [Gordionus sp. m RMFG-2023]